jgi:hypothetical protein
MYADKVGRAQRYFLGSKYWRERDYVQLYWVRVDGDGELSRLSVLDEPGYVPKQI